LAPGAARWLATSISRALAMFAEAGGLSLCASTSAVPQAITNWA
jgi:hypothetical protein